MTSASSDDDEQAPYVTPVSFNESYIVFEFNNKAEIDEAKVEYYHLVVQPLNQCNGTQVDKIGDWPERLSISLRTDCEYSYRIELAKSKEGSTLQDLAFRVDGQLSGPQYKGVSSSQVNISVSKVETN